MHAHLSCLEWGMGRGGGTLGRNSSPMKAAPPSREAPTCSRCARRNSGLLYARRRKSACDHPDLLLYAHLIHDMYWWLLHAHLGCHCTRAGMLGLAAASDTSVPVTTIGLCLPNLYPNHMMQARWRLPVVNIGKRQVPEQRSYY